MSAALVHSIESSNLPSAKKSALAGMIDRMRSGGRAGLIARVGKHGMATAHVVRQYGEAGVTGAALGLAHVMLPTGLDVAIPKTKVHIPIDLVGAVIGAGVAMAMPYEEGSTDARNVGSSMATVYAFRKTYDFLAAKAKKAGKKVGGTFAGEGDEDEWHSNVACDDDAALLSAVARL